MINNKYLGKALILLTLSITFVLWVLAKPDFLAELTSSPLILLNQLAALLGTILFSWSFFTSTRLPILEYLFGGLDKVYKVHKQVSIWGFGLIILHPLALAIEHSHHFFDWALALHTVSGVSAGAISFLMFVFLIMITLFIKQIKMPYHHWKFVHKFINLAMLLALVHVMP